MATQKAALVGCREGPWVSTSNMRNLRLKFAGSGIVRVVQKFPSGTEDIVHHFNGAGEHKLEDLPWTKVSLFEGDPAAALCFLVSGNG